MKWKRTLSILLSAAVLCACLWLAGCGQQGEETQSVTLDPRIVEYLSLDREQATAVTAWHPPGGHFLFSQNLLQAFSRQRLTFFRLLWYNVLYCEDFSMRW